VTAFHQEAAVRRYLTEAAHEMNVDPAELLAEYEHVTRRCREAGAVTREAQLALVADELGVSVEELEIELASMEAGRA
jgi:DNA-binding phage protein